MEKMFKKFMLLHAELLSIGAEKIKYLADDFIRAEIQTDSESKKFVNKVEDRLATGEKELEDRIKRIAKATRDLLGEFGVPASKDEGHNLEDEIKDLESQLKALRSQKEQPKETHAEAPAKKEAATSK